MRSSTRSSPAPWPVSAASRSSTSKASRRGMTSRQG
jgi:hypothetical protein